jgi:protocatechuate 3,4-dioxygenase alpha subunit
MYFPDEEEANALDPVLCGLTPRERAGLIARPEGQGLRFDIVLQGSRQTTFFAL